MTGPDSTPDPQLPHRASPGWAGLWGKRNDWGLALVATNSLLLALYLLWTPFHWGGEWLVATISDLVSLVLGLSLVLLAWRASRSASAAGCERWGWRLVAWGALAYWVGSLLWFLYEILLGVEPFPSLADLGYLSFVPLTLAGLLCFMGPLDSRAGRTQFLLDAGTVTAGVGAAVWYFLIDPIYRAEHAGPLETILAEAYPVGDTLLLFGVVALILRRRGDPSGRPFLWLGAGLLLHFAADSLYAHQALRKSYASGGLADATFYLSYLLMMLGPYLAHRGVGAASAARGDRAIPPSTSWAPYLAVAFAYGLLLHASQDLWTEPTGGLILAATLLTLLATARQVLAARENARLHAERAAQEGEARCASLIRHSSDAVLLLGQDLRIRYASPAAQGVLGHRPGELTGRALLDLVHAEDRARARRFLRAVLADPGPAPAAEWRLCLADGGTRALETVATNLLADPQVGGLVLNSRDIGDRRRLEDRLEHESLHDRLTGLPNRTLFRVRIEHALARTARSGEPIAVLLLDLDDFRTVNDGLGHGQGDELLRILALRLLRCARRGDTVARLGGDELGILLEDPLPLDALLDLARSLLEHTAEPFALGGREVPLSASLGIARGGAELDAETLMRRSELAMYAAKARGKARFVLYEPGMQTGALERIDLEMDLRKALGRDEILLHYQPIVRLPDGAFMGAEALARWQHPERGLLLPAAFIPLAEERSELILALGRQVLRQACRQGAAWQARVPRGTELHMGVNVSVRQLQHSNLAEEVALALGDSGLDPRSLVLEITEGTLMQGAESVMVQLRRLKALGVRLAIDDFGTGYSALGYLHRFPVDILKIDKSFLDCIREGGRDTRLAGAVIALAKTFGMKTVAEGVERQAQAEAIGRLGCALAQGYLYSRPVPAETIESRWIAPLAARASVAGRAGDGSGIRAEAADRVR